MTRADVTNIGRQEQQQKEALAAAITAQAIGDDGRVAECISKIGISSRFLLCRISQTMGMETIGSD